MLLDSAALEGDGRCDPTSGQSYALVRACELGNLELVRLFLEETDRLVDPVSTYRSVCASGRVDPTANDCRALREAMRRKHEAITALLLNDEQVKRATLCS